MSPALLKTHSRRDYGSAGVILVALGVWVFSLLTSLIPAALQRP
jgi:hypothetical protein